MWNSMSNINLLQEEACHPVKHPVKKYVNFKQLGFYQNKVTSSLIFIQRPGN